MWGWRGGYIVRERERKRERDRSLVYRSGTYRPACVLLMSCLVILALTKKSPIFGFLLCAVTRERER